MTETRMIILHQFAARSAWQTFF